MKKLLICSLMPMVASVCCFAQDARAAYQQQQAIQEVSRLAHNFDLLQNNQEAIVSRLTKLEEANANQSDSDIRAEIAAIKASIAELRASQESLRREIVADLSKRIAALPANNPPPPPPQRVEVSERRSTVSKSRPAAKQEYTGAHYEHIVESGHTLSSIAAAFGTTVAKIKAANNLKSNMLRVGQKLIIPAEEGK